MMLRSVTSRLVLSYCLLLVLLGSAFLAFTVFSFQYFTRESLGRTLAARANEIWSLSEGLLDRPDRLREIISHRFSPEAQDRFIRISKGAVLYQSGPPLSRIFRPEEIAPAAPDDKPSRKLVGDLLLYSRVFHDAKGGPVVVQTGQSYIYARSLQARLATFLLVGLPVLLLAAALAGYVLMRSALKPVEVMIAAAEAYTFNEPHSRLPLVGTEPRIEALGLALNRMLDRLDSAYSHVSRFSADAAHELRTPLTIIRGELELIAGSIEQAPDVEKAVASALEEITRLSGIVDSLVTLSRMDSLWGKAAHSPVDLHGLAKETIDQMGLLAVEKDITLVKPTRAAVVVGDRERLKQIVVNLVDNAVKYTPRGGRVKVETGIDGHLGYLIVEDTGIGIEPGHHEKVFERFYRVAPDRGEAGAGLGLAIVKSICHAHGGNVTLRSAQGQGTLVRIELPLADASPVQATDRRTAF